DGGHPARSARRDACADPSVLSSTSLRRPRRRPRRPPVAEAPQCRSPRRCRLPRPRQPGPL
ncbi:MAG: hypothetical protein AVDCRST_MAG52-694, partial [uncultured Blastococcus sp.]